MQRFFVSESLENKNSFVLPEAIKHQCKVVLRYKEGQAIVLVDPYRGEAQAKLHIEQDLWTAHLTSYTLVEDTDVEITLIQAMIRKEKWEYVLQKATELGVSRIVPLISSRSIVKWDLDDAQHKMARYRKILQEAAEQSHQARLPILESPISLNDVIRYTSDVNVVAYENEDTLALKHYLKPCRSISVLIGPEGGISSDEHVKLREMGFTSVHLGPRILRSETAGLVAITIIQTLCEP